jgi:cell division GTPase FtsZ
MPRQAIQGLDRFRARLINLDFADVKTIVSGINGDGHRSPRARTAPRHGAPRDFQSAAGRRPGNGARGVIINDRRSRSVADAVSDASTIIQEAADEDANIIFARWSIRAQGKVKITVIATGFIPTSGIRPAHRPPRLRWT